MLKKNDPVRILDTDLRPFLHGKVGTVQSVGFGTAIVNLDPGQSITFPPNIIDPLNGWSIGKDSLELTEGYTEPVEPAGVAFGDDDRLKISHPGFYHIVDDDDRLLRVDSFTAEEVIEGDEPAEPAGVWVTTHLDPNDYATIVVDSVHDDELSAYRALNPELTHPRVTFVEFGASVQDVVRETHSL